jgi:SAM-dependent methyltransferase
MTVIDVVTPSIAAYDTNAAQYAEWAAELGLHAQMNTFSSLLEPGSWVLDAGCGPGRDLIELNRRGYTATGIDLSEEFVKLALAAGADASVGDLRYLPFPESSFHGVWSCASLVHLPATDTSLALTQMRRVTSHGGALFATVKAGSDVGAWEETRHGRRWFLRWTPDTFAAAVTAAGYDVLEVVRTGEGLSSWVELYATAR